MPNLAEYGRPIAVRTTNAVDSYVVNADGTGLSHGVGFTPAERTYESLNSDPSDGFTATSALPTAQFAATSVSVAESGRVVELTLTRGPDPQLAPPVDFETSDLTGSERSDYIAAHGTVRFKPGESSQKLRVLITDDFPAEGERAFKVTLKRGRNLFVGAARDARA